MVAHKYNLTMITAYEKDELLKSIKLNNTLRSQSFLHENLLQNFGSFVHESSLVILNENAQRGSLLDLFEQSKETHWERIKTLSRAQLLKFITGKSRIFDQNHQIFRHNFSCRIPP